MKKHFRLSLVIALCIFFNGVHAQDKNPASTEIKENPIKKFIIKYGLASFYATKFHGHKTANGETYRNELLTAACNILPLNTWIRVTNLINNNSVIVKINDRLNLKNKRLVDLSSSAAHVLGYTAQGLTKVKVEVLNNFNPEASLL